MAVATSDKTAERAMSVLQLLFGDRLGRDVAVRLWDGSGAPADDPRFELIVTTPFALRAAFTPPPDLNPGRAFAEGWIDVAGDLETAIDAMERCLETLSKMTLARIGALLLGLPAPAKSDERKLAGRRHSKSRDAAAISFHYDLPVALPDGDLVALDATLRCAESAGFEVRGTENLREHYARTLRAWVSNLAANKAAAVDATNVRTERVWRLYMTGSARGFALGRMGLQQSLLAKPRADGSSRVPATRRDLYARPARN